ncbi:MAG: phage holin family protein [Lysobacter sp.]|nr:phage holin family protein [Lysobacter sp.]
MSAGPAGQPAAGGLVQALRALGATLHEAVRVRGALLRVELSEEIERRKRTLILAALAFAALHTAFLLLNALVVAAFWDTHRLAALAALAGLDLACGFALLARLRAAAAASPAPFAASFAELERDFAPLHTPP